MSTGPPAAYRHSTATVLWDLQGALPLTNLLSEDPTQDERQLVLVIGPAVVPFEAMGKDTWDPMEPFGQALKKEHFSIHQVAFKRHVGFTAPHSTLVEAADVVIFILTEFTSPAGGRSQFELADSVREWCGDDRIMILVTICPLPDINLQAIGFSTVLQCHGYTDADLKDVAHLIMNEQPRSNTPEHIPTSPRSNFPPQQSWPIHKWDCGRDLIETHALWQASLPAHFHLTESTLSSLLMRNEMSKHYVVRSPVDGSIVGFCATFITFAGKSMRQLVGSIAMIIVRQDFRSRGLGRILHNKAWSDLSGIEDVSQIQLGSTFPRLLYGPPVPLHNAKWVEDRGWSLDEMAFGRGRIVTDWAMRFADYPTPNFASAGLKFRPCQITDQPVLLEMIGRESERKSYFGWHDQYAKTLDSIHISDIVLGFEGESLVASAITYVQNSGSPCATDIPWAAAFGGRFGGVSCIFIQDDDPDMANRRDSVMVRLLQACRQSLSERGMAGVFVDAMRSDERTFVSLGYRKWAAYREVCRQRNPR
ncbi:hypothetical protein BGZ63DRAFT_424120 [Mariannaea sp. PMI_226]|nr:hypothetical protein BGZ63DRAFT_424120 [Mariannaea sp. PMI_226]